MTHSHFDDVRQSDPTGTGRHGDVGDTTATFGPGKIFPYFIMVIIAIFACITVGLVVTVIVGQVRGGPGAPPPVAWLGLAAFGAAFLWNGYIFLFRVCTRLVLKEDGLSWRTPLRSGHVSYADVLKLKEYGRPSGAQRLTLRNTTLVMLNNNGFDDLAAYLHVVAPQAVD